LRQRFAAQVRVHATQPAKALWPSTHAPKIGQLDAMRVSDDDVFDVAFAVHERADLTARLMRQFGNLTREFRRDDLLRRDPPLVELGDATQLIGFQTGGVAVYLADLSPSFHPVAPERGCALVAVASSFEAAIRNGDWEAGADVGARSSNGERGWSPKSSGSACFCENGFDMLGSMPEAEIIPHCRRQQTPFSRQIFHGSSVPVAWAEEPSTASIKRVETEPI